MNAQNRLAAAPSGVADGDLPVEPVGTQQRRVENILAVRRRQQITPSFTAEATSHLDEKLVERLLALVVACRPCRARSVAHRIDFIDKDDARRVLSA